MFKEKILIIEDDVQIQNFMVYTLENAGFSVEGVVNGKDGISYMVRKNADLILLDLGLPDIDGMEVLHRIREWSEVPIIIVSARDQDKEKAAALDDGADDYLTKPFSATELMARIRVALRHYYRMNQNHSETENRPDDTVYVNGRLKLDNGAHIAYKDNQEIHLTPPGISTTAFIYAESGKGTYLSHDITKNLGRTIRRRYPGPSFRDGIHPTKNRTKPRKTRIHRNRNRHRIPDERTRCRRIT